ncbi:electron transfer flavoprotein subunit beta [soil metagenome]
MAPHDARALEVALRLGGKTVAIHVGDPQNPALRDYLGMGLPVLTVLGPAGAGANVLPCLLSFLEERRPRLILFGMQSECGEASGMLPYLVAAKLGLPMVADVASVGIAADEALLSQALPGGRRRRLAVALPAILTIGLAGPKPRQSAFARSRRGRIDLIPAQAAPDSEQLGWTERPARTRPRKLRQASAGEAGSQAALTGLSPREAAETLHRFLVERGVVGP